MYDQQLPLIRLHCSVCTNSGIDRFQLYVFIFKELVCCLGIIPPLVMFWYAAAWLLYYILNNLYKPFISALISQVQYREIFDCYFMHNALKVPIFSQIPHPKFG